MPDLYDFSDSRDVLDTFGYWSASESWALSGYKETSCDAALRYIIRPMQLTEEDRHQLQLTPTFIPKPRMPPNAGSPFQLSLDQRIL